MINIKNLKIFNKLWFMFFIFKLSTFYFSYKTEKSIQTNQLKITSTISEKKLHTKIVKILTKCKNVETELNSIINKFEDLVTNNINKNYNSNFKNLQNEILLLNKRLNQYVSKLLIFLSKNNIQLDEKNSNIYSVEMQKKFEAIKKIIKMSNFINNITAKNSYDTKLIEFNMELNDSVENIEKKTLILFSSIQAITKFITDKYNMKK